MPVEVHCPECGKLLGEQYPSYIEMRRGGRIIKAYGYAVIVVTCENCRKTFDVPAEGK